MAKLKSKYTIVNILINKMFYIPFLIITVLLIAYFVSPLKNVGKIEVTGFNQLSENEIVDELEIKDNQFFLTLSSKNLEKKLLENELVKEVNINKSLFNKLEVKVTEFERVACILDNDSFYSLYENGRLEAITDGVYTSCDGIVVVDENETTSDDTYTQLGSIIHQIEPNVRKKISQIVLLEDEKFSNRVNVFMSDGNKVDATLALMLKGMTYYDLYIEKAHNIYGPNTYGTVDLLKEDQAVFVPYFD